MAKLVVNTLRSKKRINKNRYGHFSEHLGRCIYGGLFVGENSPIPNNKGIRTDIVNALRNIGVPVLRWPGGCFADEYHWGVCGQCGCYVEMRAAPRKMRPNPAGALW